MSNADLQHRLALLQAVVDACKPEQWAFACGLYTRHRWQFHAVASESGSATVFAYRYSPRYQQKHVYAHRPSVPQAERERVEAWHHETFILCK